MIPRILIALSLLLFAVLVYMGSSVESALLRSAVVFVALFVLYVLSLFMIRIIAGKKKETKPKEPNSQQGQQIQEETS